MTSFRAALTAVTIVLVSAVATAAPLAAQSQRTATMTVSGEGEIRVAPDMATMTLGVDLQEPTAGEASREASKRVTAMLEVLKRAGVADEDVQTTGLTLEPVYERARSDLEREPRLLGFAARNILTVTVRDLEGLGKLLDSVIDEGANSFRGLRFGLQDPSMAEDAARREAVTDALAKAAVLADAAGVTRGAIVALDEGGGGRRSMRERRAWPWPTARLQSRRDR